MPISLKNLNLSYLHLCKIYQCSSVYNLLVTAESLNECIGKLTLLESIDLTSCQSLDTGNLPVDKCPLLKTINLNNTKTNDGVTYIIKDTEKMSKYIYNSFW